MSDKNDAKLPQPAVDPTAKKSPEHIVRDWVSGNLTGGHIARNPDCWNELQAALPRLFEDLSV